METWYPDLAGALFLTLLVIAYLAGERFFPPIDPSPTDDDTGRF